MTWALRDGPADKCLSGVYTKAPSAAELAAMRAAEEAEKSRTEEARRAADAAARKASEEEAARIAEAQRQREEKARRARLGPPALREVDLVYFERDEDLGLVTRALESSNVNYSTRVSVEPKPSNVVTCTPDVDMRAVKTLVRILIRGGIKILGVRHSIHPQFKNRITVESYVIGNRRPPLVDSDIDSISECDFWHDIPAYKIRFTSDCSDPLYVWVLHYVDGDWKIVPVGWVRNGRAPKPAVYLGYEIQLDTDTFWYAARREDGTNVKWADRTVGRTLPDGSSLYFKKRGGGIVNFTCD
jgi:hypothetical protein